MFPLQALGGKFAVRLVGSRAGVWPGSGGIIWHLGRAGGAFHDLQLRNPAQYPIKPMVQTLTL
jgi:hypothetical protein